MERRLRGTVPAIAHVLLWILVASSLYEGYLVLPGLHGHSLFSILVKVLVVPMAAACIYFWYRYRPPGVLALLAFTVFVGIVGVSYFLHKNHSYPVEYYTFQQVSAWAILAATWLLARHRSFIQTLWQVGFPLYWVATIVVAFFEIHTGHHLGASSVHGKHVPTAFYYDPNNLGVAVALILPFVWFWPMAFQKRTLAAIGAAILTLLLLYVMVKSGSRGGELALLVDLAALPFVLSGRARHWAVGALIAGLVVLGALVAYARSLGPAAAHRLALSKLSRIPDLFRGIPPRVLPHGVAPSSSFIRWNIYRTDWWAIRLHPLGLGPRGIVYFMQYWLHHGSPYNTYGVVAPHSLWLEVTANFGWPGLFFFVVFYFAVVVYAWRAARSQDPLRSGLGRAAFCGLVGFVLGSFSPSSVMIGFDVMYVALAFGLAAWRLPEVEQPKLRGGQKVF